MLGAKREKRQKFLRSFAQFRKAVKGVNVQWNEQWLRTEYNTAVRSARSAANYRDALRPKEMYQISSTSKALRGISARSTSNSSVRSYLSIIRGGIPTCHQ